MSNNFGSGLIIICTSGFKFDQYVYIINVDGI